MNLEGGLEVSKKLLWVFVGQIAVKLALKVGYLKKVLPLSPLSTGNEQSRFDIILKVWGTATLQPFNLQRLTAPLLKDLNPIVNIFSYQKTDRILKIGFALSK